MHLRQLYFKARAALRFRRITFSVLRMMAIERLSRFFAERGMSGRLPLATPQSIVMRVTERCFLRCKMCGQNSEQGRLKGVSLRERQRISPSVLENMAEEIAGWRLKPLIKLTGGEPLIEWKALKPHIQRLREMGCVIKLNSNAVLLRNRDLAREIVEVGVDYLSVSIDGTRDIHNEVRGLPTAYDNSRQGVQNVLEERALQGKQYPMVLLSSVVSTINEHDVENMAEVAGEWGVDWLNIQFLNYLTPARSEEARQVVSKEFGIKDDPWVGFEIPELTKVDVEKLARTIKSIKDKAPCPVSVMKVGDTVEALREFHYSDNVITRHICHMPFVTMFMVPQGVPVFCIDYPYYRYGDVREQSLEDVWYGERAQNFRKRYMEYYQRKGKCFPQCLRCNWPYN